MHPAHYHVPHPHLGARSDGHHEDKPNHHLRWHVSTSHVLEFVVFLHEIMLHLIHKLSSNLIVPHEVVPIALSLHLPHTKEQNGYLRDDVEMNSWPSFLSPELISHIFFV